MLADCRFPVDPARPDPALAGAIVDWGPVIRHERVVGVGPDGLEDKEMVAIVAYMQRLGMDIKAQKTAAASVAAPVTAPVVAAPGGMR